MNIIKVAFCVDRAYMQHLAVSLVSLFLHNKSGTMQVFVVSAPLTAEEKDKLDKICIPFGTQLTYKEIDPSCVSELREHLHLSRAAYYRLFLPEILSEEDRIIYLDCDLAVETSIRELWETNISDKACAGWDEEDPNHIGRLGLEGDFYINSGIMVLNLDFWRTNNLTNRCMEWLEKNSQKNILVDQDVMNVLTKGCKVRLAEKWNLNPLNQENSEALVAFPDRVIHFASPVKPWFKWYDFDLQTIYWKYLSLTPWRDEAVLEEPRNFCQALAVASQYYKREDYVNACRYYQQAINFRVATHQLESLLLLECINSGHRHFNNKDYYSACESYQSCVKSWGYPVEYVFNVFKLGQGILG